MRRYPIRLAGSFTRPPLANHAAARVQGSISRGIFLLFPDRKIVFLSYQPFAGPLNLTLAEPPAEPLPVQTGDTAEITGTEIRFPKAGLLFDLSAAQPWSAPPPPKINPRAHTALASLARQAYAARPADGFAPLLPRLLNWGEPPAPLSAELEAPLARLLAARQALQAGDLTAAAVHLQGLTGLGRGLTPSGDDCLTGLLLMRCRGGRVEWGNDPLAVPLVAAAYERTTAISANLLEAAAAGEAEQRLLGACDAILAGRDQALNSLLDYGSSSGLDALVGMSV